MALKNKGNLITASLLVGLLAFSVTGCGGNNNNSKQPGGTTSSGETKVDVLAEITKDLEVADGEPLFEEEVEIRIWSINGDPDKAVQERLFG